MKEEIYQDNIIQTKKDHQQHLFGQLTSELRSYSSKTNRKKRQIKSNELLQVYKSVPKELKQNHIDINFFTDLNASFDEQYHLQFQALFTYGVEMEIWRKGIVKTVTVFIDPYIPNLLWFSSLSKSFLFDLTFTSLDIFDYQLEMACGIKHYIVLHYFQQEMPILFRENGEESLKRFKRLLNNQIGHKHIQNYPPFFSRIMKMYTMQEIKSNISRKKTVQNLLAVSQLLKIKTPAYNRKVLELIYDQSKGNTTGSHINPMKINQMNQYSKLTMLECSNFFKILHCSQNLVEVYKKYSEQKILNQLDYLQGFMSRKMFYKFLVQEQKMNEKQADKMSMSMKQTISFCQFNTYLENQKQNSAACAEQVDENLPLTDYFCYSSHNTYLSGNQLTSDSKIERYIEDLGRGLKCVEIDVHNDGDTPIITHALNDKSFCKPINFEQTIKQIAKFCKSHPLHYPIILSIENHARQQNRYKMCNILMKQLGSRIFYISEEYPYEDPTKFKTLKELIGKIIIKTDSKIIDVTRFKKKVGLQTKQSKIQLYQTKADFPNSNFQKRYSQFQEFIEQSIKRKLQFDLSIPNSLFLPIDEMTKVTGLFKSEKGVEKANSVGYQCTSLTNEKCQKANPSNIIQYTKRSFLRIYPIGTEISSSNYDPIPHLKIGAQIIAQNTQTKDDQAWMMMSYFTAGRELQPETIGYIQKPKYLRTNKEKTDTYKIFKIKMISDLHKVRIEFKGTDRDKKANISNNCQFKVFDYDESFLMFIIDEDFKECVPLRFIRQGYRVLVGKNKFYKDSGIRIIIHIAITSGQNLNCLVDYPA